MKHTIRQRTSALEHATALLKAGDVPAIAAVFSHTTSEYAAVLEWSEVTGDAAAYASVVRDASVRLGVELTVTFDDDKGYPTAGHTFSSGLHVQVRGWFTPERVQVGERSVPRFEYRLPQATS
jgi:hypothetical protein